VSVESVVKQLEALASDDMSCGEANEYAEQMGEKQSLISMEVVLMKCSI
jgi:hypothetical protein